MRSALALCLLFSLAACTVEPPEPRPDPTSLTWQYTSEDWGSGGEGFFEIYQRASDDDEWELVRTVWEPHFRRVRVRGAPSPITYTMRACTADTSAEDEGAIWCSEFATPVTKQ